MQVQSRFFAEFRSVFELMTFSLPIVVWVLLSLRRNLVMAQAAGKHTEGQ